VIEEQVGVVVLKIDCGVGLSGFHFGSKICIFPVDPIAFVKANENVRVSVAPTTPEVEVKVTSRAPGSGVKVNVPVELSISTSADVKDLIVRDSVVFA
jgi:hypothetical protein